MEILIWILVIAVVAYGVYKLTTRNTPGGSSKSGGRGDDNSQNKF